MFGLSEKNLLYSWDILNHLKYETEIAYESLKRIFESQDEFSNKAVMKFENNAKSRFDFQNEDTFRSHDREERVLDNLIRWQGYSIILSSLALFETIIKKICIEINTEFEFGFIFPKNNHLQAYKGFLNKNLQIRIEKKKFKQFVDFKLVRNAIAHDGYISKDKIEKAKNLGLKVLLSEDGNVITFENFILLEHLIEDMQHFLRNLFDQIDIKFKIRKDIS